jgi:hypothetical protein
MRIHNESGDDLVTIARFSSAIEAHLARTKLESEGIEAFVADEHMISIDPFYDLALGGVKLQTKNSNVKRALKSLGDSSNGSFRPPFSV